MKNELEIKQVEVSSGSSVRTLQIAEIRKSERLQSRVKLAPAVTNRYADAMKRGVQFPPVIVFDDGENKWLADGNYRVAAAVQAGKTEIEAEVREGSERHAFVCSLEANVAHGSPLTNADKRNGTTLILSDSELVQLSDVRISKLCGVSDNFVGKMRKRLNIERSKSVVCLRNGKEIEMSTARIGTAKCNKRIAAPKPILLLPAPESAISGPEQNGSLSRFEVVQTVKPIQVVTVVMEKLSSAPYLAGEAKTLEKFPSDLHFKCVTHAGSAGEASQKFQSFCEAVVKMAEGYGMIVEFERDSVNRNTTLFARSMDSEVTMA